VGLRLNAMTMLRQAKIELRDLHLPVSIGEYGPSDVVPDAHVLDLDLTISPDLVQVASHDMANVFDYDPLIVQIAAIARSQRFETQEYLMTLITQACAAYSEIGGISCRSANGPFAADPLPFRSTAIRRQSLLFDQSTVSSANFSARARIRSLTGALGLDFLAEAAV